MIKVPEFTLRAVPATEPAEAFVNGDLQRMLVWKRSPEALQLRDLRAFKGMSLREAADCLGMTTVDYAALELGSRVPVPLAAWDRIYQHVGLQERGSVPPPRLPPIPKGQRPDWRARILEVLKGQPEGCTRKHLSDACRTTAQNSGFDKVLDKLVHEGRVKVRPMDSRRRILYVMAP